MWNWLWTNRHWSSCLRALWFLLPIHTHWHPSLSEAGTTGIGNSGLGPPPKKKKTVLVPGQPMSCNSSCTSTSHQAESKGDSKKICSKKLWWSTYREWNYDTNGDKAYSATRNFTTYCNLKSLNLDMKFTCWHRLYFCRDHTVDSQVGQGTTDHATRKCYILRKQKCNNQQSITEWIEVRSRKELTQIFPTYLSFIYLHVTYLPLAYLPPVQPPVICIATFKSATGS
jgi:hypothetical protein